MQCKVCNTRLAPGERTCPNCGNDAGPGASFNRQTKQELPKAKMPEPEDSSGEIELELDDVTEDPLPPPRRSSPTSASKSSSGSKSEARPAARRGGAAPLFSPDAAGLRALLAEQPEALEPGLSVYRDEDGASVGAGYKTPIGEIDLLAKNSDGDLVVVTIMDKGQGEELVAEVLKRLGWVRKHLAAPKDRKVLGMVLCDEAPDDLSYTAAAVADTVAFKTYRVALTFEDIEI
jgi:hypothetical protein